MDPKQTRIACGLIAVIVLIWLVSPLAGISERAAPTLPQFQPAFDAAQALNATRDLVTQFPQRVLGSIDSRQSTGYLRDNLEKLGYTISYSHFDARLAGRRQVGRNVLAFKAGQSQEILAVVAHYDTATTTIQGAMDDGSGVGVLLELARIFSQGGLRRCLLFAVSDGEEWGMLGAQDIAQNYPERGRIVSVVSLDHVSTGDLAAICLDEVGQAGGYTPPWLRQISSTVVKAQGLHVTQPWGIEEHLQRALEISWADQGPFLRAGIPAINLNSEARDETRAREFYHSAHDTIENLQVAGIERYGRSAEGILRTIDSLSSIPKESMGALRVRDEAFLPAGIVTILQGLAFLPLLVVLGYHWINHRKYLNALRIQRELVWYLVTVVPFVIAYYLLILFRLLRLVPVYSYYPGTLKDPVLYQPFWRILNSLIGTYLVFAVGLFFLIRFVYRKMQLPDFYVSKLVLLALLFLVSLIAFAYNSYWAVTFLALPAWIWALVGIGNGPGGRAANRIWILAAGAPFYMMLMYYSSHLELGWNMVWYHVLALSTGMFTQAGFLLAIAAAALGIRFLTIQSYSRT